MREEEGVRAQCVGGASVLFYICTKNRVNEQCRCKHYALNSTGAATLKYYQINHSAAVDSLK